MEEHEKKSLYNSGLSIIYRINDLWLDSHKFSRAINYPAWNETLDRIWMELISSAKPEQEKQIGELDKQIVSSGVYSNLGKLKNENIQLYYSTMLKQKSILMNKEKILRKIQDKQGKGDKKEDDIEDYMD